MLTFGRKFPILHPNSKTSRGQRMIRKTFYFLLLVAFAAGIWCAFALWTGIYSIYTLPPSRENPDGATFLVAREEGEPMFNSPHYTPPVQKPNSQSGLSFSAVKKPKRPLDERTVVRLPYIAWTYKKSLEPQENSL
jgi:hypothetical protein